MLDVGRYWLDNGRRRFFVSTSSTLSVAPIRLPRQFHSGFPRVWPCPIRGLSERVPFFQFVNTLEPTPRAGRSPGR